jgi:hypothetical protein
MLWAGADLSPVQVPPGPSAARLAAVQIFDPKAESGQEALAALMATPWPGGQDTAQLIGRVFAELGRRRAAKAGTTPPDGFRPVQIAVTGDWLTSHLRPRRGWWPPARIRPGRTRRRLSSICTHGRAVNICVQVLTEAPPATGPQPGQAPAAHRGAPRARCATWRRRPHNH